MRVFNITNDGACLGEINLILLRKEYPRKDIVDKKVKTMTGISLRQFAVIQVQKFVRSKNGLKIEWAADCYADYTTGTLYTMDGKCLSSDKLQIVETDEKPYCSIKQMINEFTYCRGADYEISAD
jgi:hypothetical protein